MITHVFKHGFYLVACDRCGHHDTANAKGKTTQQAKEVAARWGWVFDTEFGDLCRRRAGMWKAGELGQVSERR